MVVVAQHREQLRADRQRHADLVAALVIAIAVAARERAVWSARRGLAREMALPIRSGRVVSVGYG